MPRPSYSMVAGVVQSMVQSGWVGPLQTNSSSHVVPSKYNYSSVPTIMTVRKFLGQNFEVQDIWLCRPAVFMAVAVNHKSCMAKDKRVC